MINGFLCKLAVFLHLLQRISGLLRGSERVKLRAFPTFNSSKFHCCLHTVSALAAKHSRDITLSAEAAVKFLLWQGNEARHMPLCGVKWTHNFEK